MKRMLRGVEKMRTLQIYTDGGCLLRAANKPGGWGVVIMLDNHIIKRGCGGALNTTNNAMELTAVEEAFNWVVSNHLMLKSESISTIQILSDSKYLIQTFDGVTLAGDGPSWVEKWRTNNWRTQTGSVANKALVQHIYALIKRTLTMKFDISWRHVKAHSDDLGNRMADTLATQGRQRKEPLGKLMEEDLVKK